MCTRHLFITQVMVSERESADRNNALAYMMREAGAFETKDVNVNETLEFYFSSCAVTCSVGIMCVCARARARVCVCVCVEGRRGGRRVT